MSSDAVSAQDADLSTKAEEFIHTESLTKADYYESPDGFAKDVERSTTPLQARLYIGRAKHLAENDKLADALADADVATMLQPHSVEAWAYLAMIQHRSGLFRESINSFKKAQATLPAEGDMSEQDKELKAQLHDNIVRVLTDAMKESGVKAKKPEPRLPWECAEPILIKMKETGLDKTSSAWLIINAYDIFNHAADFICRGNPEQWQMMEIPPGTFTPAAQSVLEVNIELDDRNGWDHDCPLDQVQLELKHRIRVKGWTDIKTAVRASVQEWILHAFLAHVYDKNPGAALKLYTKAVSMIEFVRTTWPDVDLTKRGAICENAFLFPLKRLTLRAYLDPGISNRSLGPLLAASETFAAELVKEAQAELPRLDTQHLDTSERLSYWIYPIADGYASLAWMHYFRGKTENEGAGFGRFRSAHKLYLAAAGHLNEDEEYHTYFLALAVDCLWRSRASLNDILPLCRRVRDAAPKMRKIWAHSQLSSARDARIRQILSYEAEHRRRIESGETTLEDVVTPTDWDVESDVHVFV
ncbi:unnamed protein product [Peniophora sp. CBMAI 1063]|nr:unnamed protein product [Peniophora sp. CBMAI 1063]